MLILGSSETAGIKSTCHSKNQKQELSLNARQLASGCFARLWDSEDVPHFSKPATASVTSINDEVRSSAGSTESAPGCPGIQQIQPCCVRQSCHVSCLCHCRSAQATRTLIKPRPEKASGIRAFEGGAKSSRSCLQCPSSRTDTFCWCSLLHCRRTW